MGECFRGWRRKAGLVTLAMASVLTVGWMRSYVVHDELFIPNLHSHHYVGSDSGRLCWERTLYGALTREQWWGCEPRPVSWDSSGVPSTTDSLASFQFGRRDGIEWWTMPFWSLVLPLALLSAWLISSKPRKRAAQSMEAADVSPKT
jgi:hypothetical protein